MPDEQKILSESEVAEIESRLKDWDGGDQYPASWNNIRALCQTVRALRVELCKWEDNHDQLCLQREQLYRDIHAENAALREQSAQETERADGNFASYERAKASYSETVNRLAQVEQERDRLRNALLPFALLDIRHLSDRLDHEPIWAINKSQITNGHIRTAARLLQEAVDAEKLQP